MEKEILDYVLVPLGLVVMVAYHLWLLRQIIRRPSITVIGINAASRRLWVRAMIEDTAKNGILAVQTLRNNIMASTVLASTAIMLSSIIAVLMSSGGGAAGKLSGAAFNGENVNNLGFSIKLFSIMLCFLGAFLLNVQSIRYYSHASMLINVPTSKGKTGRSFEDFKDSVTAEYVCRMVNRGSYFWSLGLHAFYISFPLFLWIFGPIPMFLSCVALVFLLYFLDVAANVANVFSSSAQEQEEGHQQHQYSMAEEVAV